jgi:hypothetical protein
LAPSGGPPNGFVAVMFSAMVAVKRNQNTLLPTDVLEDNVWPSNCGQKKRYA